MSRTDRPDVPGSAPKAPTDGAPWTVACLCAAWCKTCDAYRETLVTVAQGWTQRQPGMRFAWIDIEDDADALGDEALDITDFPTVLLLDGLQPRFFGPLLPHASTLDRLLHALAEGSLAAGGAADVPAEMAAAVARLAPQRPLQHQPPLGRE